MSWGALISVSAVLAVLVLYIGVRISDARRDFEMTREMEKHLRCPEYPVQHKREI